jgi:hypothetical protein
MSKTDKHVKNGVAVGATVAAIGVGAPKVSASRVTDAVTRGRARFFAEAIRQGRPMAQPGTSAAARIAQTVRNGTARVNGISGPTAERYITASRPIDALVNGANPTGKTAEVVVAKVYRDLHMGRKSGIVNPPSQVAKNVADIRLAPDPACRKDLLFGFETSNGDLVFKHNGQVKTGGPQYVSNKLVKMARTPGYGKVGYVDARFVNPDGTPKVGSGAFTNAQARRLQQAKVELRGIPDLDRHAKSLVQDIKAAKTDGLDPIARKQLEQLRNDIAKAYRARGMAGRIGGAAGIAAASAAVVSILVQLVTDGKVDVRAVGASAGTGAAFGAVGAGADAGLYHIATRALDMTPEAAKGFAQQGVAVGFCVVAIGADLIAEVRAASRGDVSTTGAVGGIAAKIALDLLPLALAPLGLVGLPVLVGAQIGGRWVIAKARDADRALRLAIAEDIVFADNLERRADKFSRFVDETNANCDATDEVFLGVMGRPVSPVPPKLQLMK